MLHAAAMLIGLFVLRLLLVQSGAAPEDFALAGAAAAASVLVAARFGGIAPSAFARAPQFLLLLVARSRAVLSGVLSTLRAGLAADVTLKPALVRVKTRPSSDFARAALADTISAAPGAIVVDSDADSLLVHVLDEEAVDAEALGQLEARVLRALDRDAA